jgi:hypothetical protein
VCNPATDEWIVLPPTLVAQPWHVSRLGFDPAVPSSLYIFVFVMRFQASGLEIYSSQAGRWIFRQSEWGENTEVDLQIKSVFFNGTLYSTTLICQYSQSTRRARYGGKSACRIATLDPGSSRPMLSLLILRVAYKLCI